MLLVSRSVPLVAYAGTPQLVVASVEGSYSCPGLAPADSKCPCSVPVRASLWPPPSAPARSSGARSLWMPPLSPTPGPLHKLFATQDTFRVTFLLGYGVWTLPDVSPHLGGSVVTSM